jgi:hypothetical protein
VAHPRLNLPAICQRFNSRGGLVAATDLTPDLTRLVSKKEAATRAGTHAAYLTLDRLVLTNPAAVLTQLQARPDLMTGREETRANYFARADVRDPVQRRLLEAYLLDSRRTLAELRAFSGIYPNANFMISKNLLTQSTGLEKEELVERDRAALEVVEEWMADPRFADRKGELDVIHRRLAEFARQAQAPAER